MTTSDRELDGLIAPGWSPNWLNGWMASIGVLRATDLRLSFTREPRPKPVFTRRGGSTPTYDDLATAIPSIEELSQSVIARELPDCAEFPRKPSVAEYAERAGRARAGGDRLLGATVTDLVSESELAHSPFDPPVPKGLTLWQRAVSVRELLGDDVVAAVEESANGTAQRVSANGLGFDARRITVATASDTSKYVDAVVELLAFESLPMFTVRGDGTLSASVRGWSGRPSAPHGFVWPAWSEPLSWAAVDHLLDEFWSRVAARGPDRAASDDGLKALGVFTAWGTVPYVATGSMDSTRGYASDKLWVNR